MTLAMPEESGSDPLASRRPIPTNYHANLYFVEENGQTEARKHAMREFWRRRRSCDRKNRRINALQRPRNLLPNDLIATGDVDRPGEHHEYQRLSESQSADGSTTKNGQSHGDSISQNHHDRLGARGIADQLLRGLRHALSSSRLGPIQASSIQMTSRHHKLLHHWFSTYATMMFNEMDSPNFNPMKDVWLPLDLSNPASFNAVMAHSAAHLAYLYGGVGRGRATNSSDAWRYKMEAVTILQEWLSTPEKALSNDAFAATIRLLSFELMQWVQRYWGTEEEWDIHQAGLQSMIHARGGMAEFQDDWRFELVVYLTSLMNKSSWFASGNRLLEISNPSDRSDVQESHLNIQNVRCLWLISFIEDMRTFTGLVSQHFAKGLSVFPSLYKAILQLRDEHQHGHADTPSGFDMSLHDHDRLVCLLSICLMVHRSLSSSLSAYKSKSDCTFDLEVLEASLSKSQGLWKDSIHNLVPLLQVHMLEHYVDGAEDIKYTKHIVNVLGYLNVETRLGIGRCLLSILCRTAEGHLLFGEDVDWTPDSLLSFTSGQ